LYHLSTKTCSSKTLKVYTLLQFISLLQLFHRLVMVMCMVILPWNGCFKLYWKCWELSCLDTWLEHFNRCCKGSELKISKMNKLNTSIIGWWLLIKYWKVGIYPEVFLEGFRISMHRSLDWMRFLYRKQNSSYSLNLDLRTKY